jgi:hypothetical protein
MATRDILTLDTVLAPRLIRILYGLALILIALCVIFGLARGIMTMTRTSMVPRPGMMSSMSSQALPSPGARMPGAMSGMNMMGHHGRMGMHRRPLLRGTIAIVYTLVLGAIALMVVRILAELGLTILAMPKRPES